MSWITKITESQLEIITGDGKSFFPLWQNAQQSLSFNNSAFDFVDTPGTYIPRKQPKSGKFPMLLYFQGEDNLTEANDFRESSKDPKAWTLRHPLYEDLTVQPVSLLFDNSSMNVTIITGTLWETIDLPFPEEIEDSQDNLPLLGLAISQDSTDTFNNRITPNVNTSTNAQNSIKGIDNGLANVAKTDSDIKVYKDLLRSAESGATNIINDTNGSITTVISLINFPFEVKDNVENRVDALLNSFDQLVSIFTTNNSEEQSVFFETQGANILSTLALTATGTNKNPSVYDFREQVIDTIDAISARYSTYKEFFDDYSYLQNSSLALNVESIINSALGNLLKIAFEAKQERTIILSTPDNIINLAFKYYGSGDENIDKFISINKITVDEYLQLNAGRKITYYV